MAPVLPAPLKLKGTAPIIPLKSLLYGSITVLAIAAITASIATYLFILAYKLPLSTPTLLYLASYITVTASALVASSLGFAAIATIGLDLFFTEMKRPVIQAPNIQFKKPFIIVPGSC